VITAPPLEPYLVERPSQVLPSPDELLSAVAVDTETSGLAVDDGARVAVVSLAYRVKSEPGEIYFHAFPFDQGRHADKGFEVARLKSGAPKLALTPGDAEHWLEWDDNLDEDEWVFLLEWLAAAGALVGCVYHNAKFDLHMLRAGTRHWPGRGMVRGLAADTMLAAKVIAPRESMGLKPTAERLWGAAEAADAVAVEQALVNARKLFGLRASDGNDKRYDLLPWAVIGPYAAQDTILTLRLHEWQLSALEEGLGSADDIDRSLGLCRALYKMECRGFGPLRSDVALAWAETITKRIAELEAAVPFDPPTQPAATTYFFETLGLAPWKIGEEKRGWLIETGSGPPQHIGGVGGKEARERIKRRFPHAKKITWKQGQLTSVIARRMAASGVAGAAELAELLDLKIANQMFYANYAALAGPDGKLRTDYKQAFVKSGRMSTSRVSMQGLPRKLGLSVAGAPAPEPRGLFAVAEGRERWGLDLSQAELRIAAALAPCPSMAELLASGADLHGVTCTKVFEVTPEHPDWDELRSVAKQLTFGQLFLMGPRTFQNHLFAKGGIEWDYARCRDAVYGWRETYPEIEAVYHELREFVIAHGYVELYDGTRSYFGALDWERTGWNRRVQGSLARFVETWTAQVESWTERYDALCLTVHDACYLDLPIEDAADVVADVTARTEALWTEHFDIPGRLDASRWSYHEKLWLPGEAPVLEGAH
jgi:DNA polymerase I-like protein with 3'-5' exonuclease and polymerase domains